LTAPVLALRQLVEEAVEPPSAPDSDEAHELGVSL
jgi:hypothetical protein